MLRRSSVSFLTSSLSFRHSAVEETENAPHVARLKAITTVTPSIATWVSSFDVWCSTFSSLRYADACLFFCACTNGNSNLRQQRVWSSSPYPCTFVIRMFHTSLSYVLIDVPTNFRSLVHDFLPRSFTSRAFTRPCTQFDWNVYRALVYRALFSGMWVPLPMYMS